VNQQECWIGLWDQQRLLLLLLLLLLLPLLLPQLLPAARSACGVAAGQSRLAGVTHTYFRMPPLLWKGGLMATWGDHCRRSSTPTATSLCWYSGHSQGPWCILAADAQTHARVVTVHKCSADLSPAHG
jgi:hypothetical protein